MSIVQDEYSIDEFKKILIETFKFTIDFLNRHNLQWFVGQGSCIGVVRHHGLIPWDDDIDILMPRDDYNKLINLYSELEGTEYELMSWENSQYIYPFAKMVNRHTTLWEQKFQPFIIGVYIDIFPMDLSDKPSDILLNEIKEYDRVLNYYWSSISVFTFKDSLDLLKNKRLRYFVHSLMSAITRLKKDYYLEKLKALDKEHNQNTGSSYVLFSSCFAYRYEKEIFKKEWFENYVLMPFEDIEVRVPVGYDSYLKHVYGDYMKLPPVDKRVTRHYHYYINLKERKTKEEIIEMKNRDCLKEE